MAILASATCKGYTLSVAEVDSKEGTYTTAQPHHHIPIRIEANLQLADIALNLSLAMLVGTGVLIFDLLEDGVHIIDKRAVNNQHQR
jgi:hypothetical protein